MTETPPYSRRTLLQGAWTAALSLALGSRPAAALAASKRPQPRPTPLPVQPSLAISLTLLQEKLAKLQAQRSFPDKLGQLWGMNRLQGVMTTSDGELILLGTHDAAAPLTHLEDLIVGARNAYQVSAYQGIPGCSIDPWVGADDPWRIQRVAVMGMPPQVAMATRFVSVDAELKKVSAGTVALAHGVTSLYDLRRASDPLCAGQQDQATPQTITHRFWFYTLYPPAPRFMQDEGLVLILQPVGVQLLTEREFLNQAGQRQGATPASPMVQEFANTITQLLVTTTHPDYTRLVQDFCWIELGQLLHFQKVPASNLRYFLHDYPLREVPVPAYVGGIRREERGEVVCDTQITEQRVPQGTRLSSTEHVRRYHYVSKGGVEANIRLTPTQFTREHAGILSRLRQQVHASRPSAQALMWSIKE